MHIQKMYKVRYTEKGVHSEVRGGLPKMITPVQVGMGGGRGLLLDSCFYLAHLTNIYGIVMCT